MDTKGEEGVGGTGTWGSRLSRIEVCVRCVLSRVRLFCDPVDCDPPGSSAHGISPGKNAGVGCHFLLQGIFPTQGLNPRVLHCRQILYSLSHLGSGRL